MDIVPYNGWERNVRLANAALEVIVTQDVGPRVIRFGFHGERNVFAEIAGQQGGSGEDAWMIRGGHRLWIAPEAKPASYEPDNVPVEVEETGAGVTFRQEPGPITHVAKRMTVALAADRDEVVVTHTLENRGEEPVELAPWALTVMAPGGLAVVPLPHKIPHTERLTPNQAWILWPYTDFSDPRWTLGERYVLFRQDAERGPNKLGIAHREGWVAYALDGFVFLKMFERLPGQVYADGGANFQTFSNAQMLELESLGPLVSLEPGAAVTHVERWMLFRDVPPIESEADADMHLLPLVRQGGVIPSPES
jgi:hypothetical protein